jgi:PPOX class probable F420-dependent enzyme
LCVAQIASYPHCVAAGWPADATSDFGKRVERRLRKESLIWLVTVDPRGTPQPSPVWFVWEGAGVLIYSEPNTPKLRNIAQNPRVSLHFDGDGQGGDIVVISGEARVASDALPPDKNAAYGKKYDAGGFYKRIGLDAATFARRYSVPIVVLPTGLRGY